MRAATINNRVLLFGEYECLIRHNIWIFQNSIYFHSGGSDDDNARDDILEYDPETDNWTQISTIREARDSLAVSVVDFTDYAESCK